MIEHERPICIFPYIELSEPLAIRGEMLFPYMLLNDIKIEDTEKDRLREIHKYFYWYSNQNIENVAWTIGPKSSNSKRLHDFKTHLEEIRKILGYLCCIPDDRPHGLGLYHNYEQADYYVFSPNSYIWKGFLNCISFDSTNPDDENSDKYVDGHVFSLNQLDQWNITEGCRIYPSSREVGRPFKLYELFDDVSVQRINLSIRDLFHEELLSGEQEDRIFNALEWYNRSCRAEITTDISLIYLSVAFESLLCKRREEEKGDRTSKTQIIYDAIQTLIGDVPRLDKWFEQFYNARSRVLHEGEWSQLRFTIVDESSKSEPKTNEHGYLTHYGWLVFRICMNAKLTGLVRGAQLDLKSKFFNHQERVNHIETILSNTTDPYDALQGILGDIKALYDDILGDTNQIQLETLWKVGKLLARALLEVNPDITPDQLAALQRLASDIPPIIFEGSEAIIQHTLLVFQQADELPEKKVQESAIKELNSDPAPSILEIKNHVTQILNDSRNRAISNELRQRLKNILQLIDFSVYHTNLKVFTELQTNWAGNFITMGRPYSLIDGYSRFVNALVRNQASDHEFYMLRYRHQNRD
jgi:hypothetical protein